MSIETTINADTTTQEIIKLIRESDLPEEEKIEVFKILKKVNLVLDLSERQFLLIERILRQASPKPVPAEETSEMVAPEGDVGDQTNPEDQVDLGDQVKKPVEEGNEETLSEYDVAQRAIQKLGFIVEQLKKLGYRYDGGLLSKYENALKERVFVSKDLRSTGLDRLIAEAEATLEQLRRAAEETIRQERRAAEDRYWQKRYESKTPKPVRRVYRLGERGRGKLRGLLSQLWGERHTGMPHHKLNDER